jgi:hypothetical protein
MTQPPWPIQGHTYSAEDVVEFLDRDLAQRNHTKRQLHEATQEIERLRQRLETSLRSQQPTTPAPASGTSATIPTPDTTLQAMGEIMTALTSGTITAADAKARLYAHQIALSAIRTIDTAQARRQKEERLRRTQKATPFQPTKSSTTASRRFPKTATASPRREAQRRNRTTTSNARRRRKENSPSSRSTPSRKTKTSTADSRKPSAAKKTGERK